MFAMERFINKGSPIARGGFRPSFLILLGGLIWGAENGLVKGVKLDLPGFR